jgi:hypothetical protein
MNNNYQKETQTKLTKGLLDIINLPPTRANGEKSLCKERLEHEYRKAAKSVQAH